MTLDEKLFNSQLTKPNLSPNLLYTETHEHQDNVNFLDEYTLFFHKQRFFFNSASVLLNFLMNRKNS